MNDDLQKAWEAIQGVQRLSQDPEIRSLAEEAERRMAHFWSEYTRENRAEKERLRRDAEFEAGCG